jgi:hypothetical protein
MPNHHHHHHHHGAFPFAGVFICSFGLHYFSPCQSSIHPPISHFHTSPSGISSPPCDRGISPLFAKHRCSKCHHRRHRYHHLWHRRGTVLYCTWEDATVLSLKPQVLCIHHTLHPCVRAEVRNDACVRAALEPDVARMDGISHRGW